MQKQLRYFSIEVIFNSEHPDLEIFSFVFKQRLEQLVLIDRSDKNNPVLVAYVDTVKEHK